MIRSYNDTGAAEPFLHPGKPRRTTYAGTGNWRESYETFQSYPLGFYSTLGLCVSLDAGVNAPLFGALIWLGPAAFNTYDFAMGGDAE